MVGSEPNREESIGSQRQDHFLNLQRRRDREVSVHTTCTGGSQSRSGSHISHENDTKSMQHEIDRLQRRLRCERRRRTPLNSDISSDDDRDGSYRPESRTLLVSPSHVMRTRAVQIHPSTRPTRRTDGIRPETGRLNYSDGSSSPKTDSSGSGFGFPPLKPKKSEPTERFPDSS